MLELLTPLLAERPTPLPDADAASISAPKTAAPKTTSEVISPACIATPESTHSVPSISDNRAQLNFLNSSPEIRTTQNPESVVGVPTQSETAVECPPAKLGVLKSTQPSQVPSSVSLQIPRAQQPSFNSGEDGEATARIAERRKVIEARLAEIVARERGLQVSTQQDEIVTTAVAYANYGQFKDARQVIQDPALPPTVRRNVLDRINSLEADNNRLAGAQPVIRRSLARPPVSPKIVYNGNFYGNSGENVPAETQQERFVNPQTIATAPLGQEYYREYYNSSLPPLTPPSTDTFSLRFPLPTPAPITSPYGWRVHPVLGYRRFHTGTDIGASYGTPVLAAYSGKVTNAKSLGGYGLAVVLEHNDGTMDTLYGHLSEILVSPGQWVEQGSMIGRVGSTGLSTGPHLHFELRQKTAQGWERMDPGPLLKVALAQLMQQQQSSSL